MNILQACADPQLFAPWFARGEWSAWRAFLAALFGLKMEREALRLYAQCTSRSAPPARGGFDEAWVIVGRRGGKSFTTALVGAYAGAFVDYRPHLAPGERATVLILACDRKQSRVIFRYLRAFFREIPMLARMVQREDSESLDLTNGVTIEVGTASFRSTRGYTLAAVLADETAFWRSDESANPDTEILAALRPGLVTIPGARLLCIGSPYARRGAMWDAFRRHFGRDDSRVLVWKAPSRVMNPTLPERVVQDAIDRDPLAAAAEYMAEFRTDVESFIARETVEACTGDAAELPPAEGVRYAAFVDPSGGSADAMTLAIAHKDAATGRAVLDAVRVRRPPFSPESVVAEFAMLLKAYRITSVKGDRYAGEWPRERFRVHGVAYEPAERTRSELYLELLPMLNSGSAVLLRNSALLLQLCGLERRTSRAGKDTIDHAPGAHDDLANAVAGALVGLQRPAARPSILNFDDGPAAPVLLYA
jgi:hypothetical protein